MVTSMAGYRTACSRSCPCISMNRDLMPCKSPQITEAEKKPDHQLFYDQKPKRNSPIFQFFELCHPPSNHISLPRVTTDSNFLAHRHLYSDYGANIATAPAVDCFCDNRKPVSASISSCSWRCANERPHSPDRPARSIPVGSVPREMSTCICPSSTHDVYNRSPLYAFSRHTQI